MPQLVDPNIYITNPDMPNGMPDISSMVSFVDVRVIKYNEVKAVVTNGKVEIFGSKSKQSLSMMGFDPEFGYTTRNADSYGTQSTIFEGFGVKSVSIAYRSKIVPEVKITFVDIRGSLLFNTGGKSSAGYDVLFEQPAPLYVLTLKGFTGNASQLFLHCIKTDIVFESETGNYIITCDFIGKQFGALADTKMDYMKAAYYLANPSARLNLSSKDPVVSTFELVERTKKFYNEIKNTVKSTNEVATIEKSNSNITSLSELKRINHNEPAISDSIKNIIKPIQINNTTYRYTELTHIGNGQFQRKPQTTTGVTQEKAFSYIYNMDLQTASKNYDKLIGYLEESKLKYINGNYLSNVIGANINDIIIRTTYPDNLVTPLVDTNNVSIYYDYTAFWNKLIQQITLLSKDKDNAGEKLSEKVSNLTLEMLGFIPNSNSVFEILCNDIDTFYNLLKKVGEESVAPKLAKDNDSILEAAAFPEVILGGNSDGKPSTRVYPPVALPNSKDWSEVKFVEDFINILIRQRKEEEALAEMQKTKEDGTKRLTPAGFFDVSNNIPDLTYFGKLRADDIIKTVLYRYLLLTQYTYKGTYITNVPDISILDYTDLFDLYSYFTSSRESLYDYIAESEAGNIYYTLNDNKVLDLLESTLKNLNVDSGDFIGTLNRHNELSETKKFINDTTFNKVIQVDSETPLYADRRDDNSNLLDVQILSDSSTVSTFSGLKQVIEIDVNSKDKSFIDPSYLTSEEPTGSFKNFIDHFYDSNIKDGIKILKGSNILYFTDQANESSKSEGKFYNQKSDFVGKPNGTTVSEGVNFVNLFGLSNIINDASGLVNGYTYAELLKVLIAYDNINDIETAILNRLKWFDGRFYSYGISDIPNIYSIRINTTIYSVNDKNDYRIELNQKDKDKLNVVYNNVINNINSLLTNQTFLNYKNSYLDNKTNLEDTFDKLLTIPAVSALFNRTVIFNKAAFTFIADANTDSVGYSDFISFHNITSPSSLVDKPVLYTEYEYPYGGPVSTLAGTNSSFSTSNSDNGITKFFSKFKSKMLSLISQKRKEIAQQDAKFNSIIKDNDLKGALYYDFKHIYDKWISGTENLTNINSGDFAFPFSNGTSLFNKFRFIDRAFNDIGGNKGDNKNLESNDAMIIDISDLDSLNSSKDTNAYTLFATILAKNNFEFFPLPEFGDIANNFGSKNNFGEIFKINNSISIDKNSPMFVAMYIGGYSRNLNTSLNSTSPYSDDGASILTPGKTPKDFTQNNLPIFLVNVGNQSESLFKVGNITTSEFTNTSESLKNIDDVFKSLANNTPVSKSQSLYTVYQQRSYNVEVTIIGGNMSIYPTMYIELNQLPLFSGIYIILAVSHEITAETNKITTKLSCTRISKNVVPLVTTAFASILSIYTDFASLGVTKTSGSINGTASEVFIPNTAYIRIKGKETKTLVSVLSTNSKDYRIIR